MECCNDTFILRLYSTSGLDYPSFPVVVYDINQQFIGYADTPQEYADLWNANPINAAVGQIIPGQTTIQFIYKANQELKSPPTLYADPAYIVIDPEGEPVLNAAGDYVRYQ